MDRATLNAQTIWATGGRKTAMDVIDAIHTRRSVRCFTSQEISNSDLALLLEAASWAPSAGNRQPWRFVVVKRPAIRELVRKVSPGVRHPASAYIAICFPCQAGEDGGAAEPKQMYESYIPALNIALAAHSLGLGSCILTSFSQAALREVLGIPRGVIPVVLVALGYAAEIPTPPHRLGLSDLAYRDRYGDAWRG